MNETWEEKAILIIVKSLPPSDIEKAGTCTWTGKAKTLCRIIAGALEAEYERGKAEQVNRRVVKSLVAELRSAAIIEADRWLKEHEL